MLSQRLRELDPAHTAGSSSHGFQQIVLQITPACFLSSGRDVTQEAPFPRCSVEARRCEVHESSAASSHAVWQLYHVMPI